MKRPAVSVILPAYNSRQHVDEAIRSVLDQRGMEFELLIADDASRDGTWDRIHAYRADPRVRAWRFRRRKGSARARNLLIARARGKYLSICDHDDVMLPGNLRCLAAVLDREPKVGVVYGELRTIDARGRPLKRKPPALGLEEGWDLLVNVFRHPGSMMRRRLVLQVGGYRPIRIIHDYDLFLRLAEITRFRVLRDRPYYFLRKWSGSSTRRPEDLKVWRQVRREAIRRRYGVRVRW